MDTTVSLQVADYIVLAVVLLISMGIGVLFAVKDFRNANMVEYLLGGRSMSMIPVALSIFATFTSGIALLGIPMDFYLYGEMSGLVTIGMAMACIYTMLLIVPLMYPLRLVSLYEYLELRFQSSALRLLAVMIGILQTLGYMAIALLSPALALQAGVGLPMWLSVGIIGLIGTVYTTIGGIKSVVWTDAIQCLVTICGVLTIIIKGFSVVGGGHAVFKIIQESGRTSYAEFSLDPRVKNTWWGTTFGFSVFWFSIMCNQSSLQRIAAMKSMAAAKQAFLINSILFLVFGGLMAATAWVTYAYFVHIRCDPFQAGLVKNRNQLPPYFVMHALKDIPAIGGLYMAMIFSGSLSTLSSGINSLAAITMEDILKKPLHNFQESTLTLITKLLVFLYGILIIGMAYGANSVQGSVSQMAGSITGPCSGAVLGIFILGAIIPWANKYGAMAGGVLAIVFCMWLAIGNQMYGGQIATVAPPPTDMCFLNSSQPEFTNYVPLQQYSDNTTLINSKFENQSLIINSRQQRPPSTDRFFLYEICNEWVALIGCTITLLTGSVISYLTRKCTVSVTDPKYMFTFIRGSSFFLKQDTKYEQYGDEDKEIAHLMMPVIEQKIRV